MIRFFLLLLLLPGAELTNDTYEVETSTTTTSGSQFTMAVTTLRKPLGSRTATKKTPVRSLAPKTGNILNSPTINTSTMTEETQAVQGIINTTSWKHKNPTHKAISSTQNITHWHPTKMPVTAKNHPQRESSIKKPIIKKVPTPPSKLKSMMKTTMRNPSARYQSPLHIHHKNVTIRPGMGHFHYPNASSGVVELAKSHRTVTALRNSLKLGQKDRPPAAHRVKQLPLEQLKDKANSTSVLLSAVISNSSQSVSDNINHITHSFPNSSFLHGKKTLLHKLNSLNASEHVWRAENMSLVPQIDKDLLTPGLLRGVHLSGARQSEMMQELNSKITVRVPDTNVIYNYTKQNLRDTAERPELGQNGTVQLEPDKRNQVSPTEPVEIGTVINRTKTTSGTQSLPNNHYGMAEVPQVQTQVWTTTQSEIQANNNVEQQYRTRTELTTGGHIHRNQTHSHRHHKHSLSGEHKQSDNTVSQHTVTSSGTLSSSNRHHLRHFHNFTHPHEHNEHRTQHQMRSSQVTLGQVGKQVHPSQSPLQGENTRYYKGQATIKNESDTGDLSHLKNNFSEPEATTSGPRKHFTIVEPKLTTQSLQNPTTVSHLTTQNQRVFTALYEPLITDNKTDPYQLHSLEEESLPSPYQKTTIKPVRQKHLSTQSSTYNTTKRFQMELTTQTQPKLTSQMTTHKKTEVTVHSIQTLPTEIELSTWSQLKLLEPTQPWEPTQNQPGLTTHSSPYQSTWTYSGLSTETQSTKVRIESSTEPLLNSSLITETHPHPFKVTEPTLTTHSVRELVTLKDFKEMATKLSTKNQYQEHRTTPHSRTEPITHGHTESLTQTDSILNKIQSNTQTGPLTKGNTESFTPITITGPINWMQTQLTTQETEQTTQAEPTTTNQVYSITQTESITKTATDWVAKTQTVSPLETEPNTTNSNSKSTVHKEITTKNYTELPTQTHHIIKGTTEPTSKPRRMSTTPRGTLIKNETESIAPKTESFNQTTTMEYGRDETKANEQTEPTSKVPLNSVAPYSHISSTHRGHLQSTQALPDLGTQTYLQNITRPRSDLTTTGQPGVQTANEHLTSVPNMPSISDDHITTHTTTGPWTEVSSSSLTSEHEHKDGRWDSGPTLFSNVPIFYPTKSHTSERDHANELTTVKSSSTESKSVTSPQSNIFTTQTLGEMMSMQPGRDRIFIIDEQQPVFKVQAINVTYKMNMTHSAACEQLDSCKPLLLQELTSAYKSTPGFDRIEILNLTVAGTALEYKVLFSVRPGSLMSAVQELVLSNPSMLSGSSEKLFAYRMYNTTLTDNHADPCTDWFACPRSFQCVPLRKLSALCLSPCHSIFCHNNGICIHRKGQDPECQCPIGRDFWYMGQTCDYRMTHHRLAAIACAVVFCIIICAAAAVFILVRRFQTQILQQKVAQTQSSYRRFSRFDDVPTHFWCPSQTWLTASASLNSLDNPAFSSSEEVFPLQALGSCVCGCQDGARSGSQTNQPQPPARPPPRLETSCSSVNDLMIDSGKASDVSVCSWPMEPIHWTPFPILHQLSLQSPLVEIADMSSSSLDSLCKTSRAGESNGRITRRQFHARRPHSYFEGMELVNTERSWTA